MFVFVCFIVSTSLILSSTITFSFLLLRFNNSLQTLRQLFCNIFSFFYGPLTHSTIRHHNKYLPCSLCLFVPVSLPFRFFFWLCLFSSCYSLFSIFIIHCSFFLFLSNLFLFRSLPIFPISFSNFSFLSLFSYSTFYRFFLFPISFPPYSSLPFPSLTLPSSYPFLHHQVSHSFFSTIFSDFHVFLPLSTVLSPSTSFSLLNIHLVFSFTLPALSMSYFPVTFLTFFFSFLTSFILLPSVFPPTLTAWKSKIRKNYSLENYSQSFVYQWTHLPSLCRSVLFVLSLVLPALFTPLQPV